MLTQQSLLDLPPKPIEVNTSVAPADRKRLSRQCSVLLRALIATNLTAREIMDMGILNHTGRLSDLRKAGCTITGTNRGGGLWEYRLDYFPDDLRGAYS